MTPQAIERLRRIAREKMEQLRGNQSGILRALDFPETNSGAASGASADATLALDALALLEAVEELEQRVEP